MANKPKAADAGLEVIDTADDDGHVPSAEEQNDAAAMASAAASAAANPPVTSPEAEAANLSNNPNVTTIDRAPATAPAVAQEKPEPKDAKADGNKAKIAKLVGVKTEDVIAYNSERQTAVTAQGGKYKLSADGKSVLHLAGPVPASAKKDEDEE